MLLFQIILFLAILVNFVTSIYVIAVGKKDLLNRSYIVFSLFICLFAVSDFIFFWLPVHEDFLIHMVRGRILFYSGLTFLFVNVSYRLVERKNDYLYYICLIVALAFIPLSLFTNVLYTGYFDTSWGRAIVPGTFHAPIHMILCIPVLYALLLLVNALRTKLSENRQKVIKMIFGGVIITMGLSLVSNTIIPSVLGKVEFPPLASTFTALFSIIIFISIRYYNFLTVDVDFLESSFQAVFENVNDAILVINSEGDVVRCNRVAQRMAQKKGVKGSWKLEDLVTGYNNSEHYENREMVIGEPPDDQKILLSRSPIGSSVPAVYFLVLIKDVSEIYLLEQDVEDGYHRYIKLFEDSSAPMFILDEKGYFVDVNPVAVSMLGSSINEIVGSTIFDYNFKIVDTHEHDKGDLLKAGTGFLVDVKSESGNRVLDLHMEEIRLQGRKLLMGCGRDLTDRIRYEENLEEQNAFHRLRADIWKLSSDESLMETELIQKILDMVGPVMGFDRACYNELDGSDIVCKIEWLDRGISPSAGTRFPAKLAELLLRGDWVELSFDKAMERIPAGMKTLTRPVVEAFVKILDIKAIYAVPYFIGKELKGLLSFDLCNKSNKKFEMTKAKKELLLDVLQISMQLIEIRRISRSLIENEYKLRMMNENVGDVIWSTDGNFKLNYLSPSAEELFGSLTEDLMGRDITDFLTEDSRKIALCVLHEEIARESDEQVDLRRKRRLELDLVKKDKTTIPIEVLASILRNSDGLPTGIVGIARDVRERLEAEKEKRLSNERFRGIFSSMSNGVAIYKAVDNGNNFVFVDFNPAGEKIDKVKTKDLIGKKVTEVFPGVIEFGLIDVFKRVYETGMPEHFPIRLYADDRISGWRENYVFRLESGEIVSVYDDLTDEKRSEEEKSLMKKQIFLSSKLASIGELAAGVGHEINNPLTIMMGNMDKISDMISEESFDSDQAFKSLEKMYRAGNRVTEIVRGLRMFARSDSNKIENVDLIQAVEDILLLTGVLFEKEGIRIYTHFSAKKLIVLGNRGRIEQVILNLINNSRDALGSETRGKIDIHITHTDDEVSLVVEDNGCGIETKFQEKVFESFFTTKEVGKGSGLGLGIVKSIVEGMDGKIHLESTPGEGTQFALTFPRGYEEKIHIPRERVSGDYKFSGKVLIVDDEEDIREILNRLLRGFGLDVTEAKDGMEALEILSKDKFDLIITDLKMPRLGGEELVERMREHKLSDAKIIVITGAVRMDEKGEKELLKRLSADGFLDKPFSREVLGEQLRDIGFSQET